MTERRDDGKDADRLPAVKTMAEVIREPDPADKKPAVMIGTLNVFTAPAKAVSEPLERRYAERYHGQYPFARYLFVLDLALLLVGVLLAAFAVTLFSAPPAAPRTVAASLRVMPATAKNGEQVTLLATIRNGADAALTDASATFHLPKEFRVVDAPDLFDAATGSVSLGTLPAGAVREFGITVVAIAGAGPDPGPASVFIRVVGSRRGTLSEFVAKTEVPLTGSVVELTATVPESIVPGEQESMTLTMANRGGIPFGPLEVSFCLNDVLAFAPGEETRPCAVTAPGIPLLQPNDAATSVVRFHATSAQAAGVITASVSLRDDDGGAALLATRTFTIPIADPGVEIALTRAPGAVASDGVFPVSLRLPRIAEGTVVEGVSVLLLRSDGREDIVAGADPETLAALRQGRTATFTVRLPTDVSEQAILVAEAQVTDAKGRAASPRSGSLTVPLPPKPSFSAVGRYFTLEGEQIGRGTIPPTVGEKTEYWMFWTLGPVSRDIREFEVRATLPAGVSWTGKQTVGIPDAPSVRYIPATREVRWTVRDIPEAVADDGIAAGFAVSYLPPVSARGKEATLLDPSTVRLTTVDGAKTALVAPAVTTALPDDARAEGQGIVE